MNLVLPATALAEGPAAIQLEDCKVSTLNRTAQVQSNGTFQLEIVALSLQSANPIQVTGICRVNDWKLTGVSDPFTPKGSSIKGKITIIGSGGSGKTGKPRIKVDVFQSKAGSGGRTNLR